jgi:uncharacterized protein YjbJ (UPF0337 family)
MFIVLITDTPSSVARQSCSHHNRVPRRRSAPASAETVVPVPATSEDAARGAGRPKFVASATSRTRFARPDGREDAIKTPIVRGGNTMVDINSGLAEAVKGVVEDAKGRAKVIIGAVIGRDDLYKEGKAQQDKAQAQRNAAKKEAEAKSARAAAQVAEKRQKAEQ